ncbi:MAG: helix-hairpin-helix domain-containing protein [Gemmatimonadota bacterium]
MLATTTVDAPSRFDARRPDNENIAEQLDRIADLLEAQDANPFRIGAYLSAARTLRESGRPATAILEGEGRDGLMRLPHIGGSIAALIEEYVRTGRIGLLDRLEGHVAPEALFTRVPGIGERLAERIHARLGIESLEDLELAAYDGRLAEVPGFGQGRVRAVRTALAGMLSRSAPRRSARRRDVSRGGSIDRPSVATLLDVDAEYREKAEAGELRKIAPRRFNPKGEAWLPILHTERGDWHFTALYSNTARAHQLGRTHDWVVIYYDRNGAEGQCTVVTEHRGELEGLRVVRGREIESAEQLEASA